MNDSPLVCPRRSEIPPGPFKILEGQDSWSEGRTCSFCGSLDPALVLEGIKDGTVTLGPTDKNYKVYVEGLGRFAKFYFQHFSEEQKREFIDLLNQKRIKFSEPGHFYRLPFFIQVEKSAGA